ncbi:MaoC family dehydratase [Paraburkholderia sp. C35]|uniref:MaoC family dehydratase n=1 Tax=Paraburkholderia sp. C35 TaxID=2126993 RepID=UPI000D6960C9|nr:MaoC family dehydratase [Paraburkholderia sp. C35]
MNSYSSLGELKSLVGTVIGVSEWTLVDQERIQQFADATGDHQWIHLDVERAKQGPFGTTIAHGFLTVSLVPAMMESAFKIEGIATAVNYGLNRVRFPSPVPVNSKVRGSFKLQEYQELTGGAQLTFEVTMEIEGREKPVCFCESLGRFFVGTTV